MDALTTVKTIMAEYAESTGLSNAQKPPRRYLWTDAFGVCNFLELHRRTGDGSWRESALHLVDQVHNVLGVIAAMTNGSDGSAALVRKKESVIPQSAGCGSVKR